MTCGRSARELTIETDGASLSATYTPAGDVVVVGLHGAAEGTRSSLLLQHLHVVLPPLGVGVVTFDRRGEGSSTGQVSLGRFHVQAADALSIAESIDAGTVGLWGFSQGAWVAPLAAGLSDRVGFLIGVAATGVTPSDQMMYGVAEHLRRAGHGPAIVDRAVALRRDFQDDVHGRLADRLQLARQLESASKESWWELVYLPSELLSPADRAGWIAEMDFDPTPSFREASVPVLLFYGEEDEWTPVGPSAAAWREAQGENATIVIIPGVGHDLRGPDGVLSSSYESHLVEWMRRWTQDTGPVA